VVKFNIQMYDENLFGALRFDKLLVGGGRGIHNDIVIYGRL